MVLNKTSSIKVKLKDTLIWVSFFLIMSMYKAKLEITLHPTEIEAQSSKAFMEAYAGYPTEALKEIFKDTPQKEFPLNIPIASFEEANINYLIYQNNDEVLLLSNNKDIKIGDLCLSRYGLKPLTQEVLDKLCKPPLFAPKGYVMDKRKLNLHKVIFNFSKPEIIY